MSQRDSGFEKIRNDFYATPEWVTECLMVEEEFIGDILEPACGHGHISVYLKNNGLDVCTMDIISHESVDVCADFFSLNHLCLPNHIITNPPYGNGGRLATKFIEHALSLTERQSSKVAMLLRADFDSGKTRSHLFADCPAFKKKIVLTDRIAWANIKQTATPSVNHAWFIWDWWNTEKPVIAYRGKK